MMGKLILCTGREADHPFTFSAIGKTVSNMEELCYIVYHHVFEIQEQLYSRELIQFIREELGMPDRAQYLEGLLENHAGAKDLIVAIFCSTDYYEEHEIKQFLNEYDAYYKLDPAERRKREADRLLEKKRYREAAAVYQDILGGGSMTALSDCELGNLLHNLAVIEIREGMFQRAQERFAEAYLRNNNEETLKHYLFSLKLNGQEELFEEEMKRCMPRQQLLEEMTEELYQVRSSFEQTREYFQLEKLKELQSQGRIKEYYQGTDTMLEELKNRYRCGRNVNQAD